MALDTKVGRKEAVFPEDFPVPNTPYSPAVKAGDFVFPSGMLATDFKNGVAPEACVNPGRPLDEMPIKLQTRYAYRMLERVLRAAGSGFDRIVRIEQFSLGREYAAAHLEARNEFLLNDRPASTLVSVNSQVVPGTLVQLDIIAITEREGFEKDVANSHKLIYNATGGYSQAVMVGDWVFSAGSCASDGRGGSAPYYGAPGTGMAPEARVNPNTHYGSEIKVQTLYTMRANLAAMLEAGGASLDSVVRAQVYLTNLEHDWPAFLEAWRELYPKNAPTLVVCPVGYVAPLGGRIEISLIALRKNSTIKPEVIQTDRAPAPVGHGPQALKVGPLLFFSTQMAADENGLATAAAVNPSLPYHAQAGKKEMEYILRNVESICHAAGARLDCIAKSRILHTDLRDFAPGQEVWAEAFPDVAPAATVLGVAAPLPVPGCSLVLDLIGYVGE